MVTNPINISEHPGTTVSGILTFRNFISELPTINYA